MEVAHLDQLLHVVGDVRAEIVAARAKFARRQLLVADVEEQQRLDGVDVGAAAAVELVLDDVEQAAMQTLDERQRFQIGRAHFADALGALLGGISLEGRIHGVTSSSCNFAENSPGVSM